MLFIIFLSHILSYSPNVSIIQFNKTEYDSFLAKLPKNNFLITLALENKSKHHYYYDYFLKICMLISSYSENNINFSYSMLIDKNYQIKNGATVLIYYPGITEMECNILLSMPITFNSNKILSKCLALAKKLYKLEKKQKINEINRIVEELQEITKLLKKSEQDDKKQEQLIKDYSSLINELMQYLPEKEQDNQLLKLNPDFYKNILQNIKKNRNQHDNERLTENFIVQKKNIKSLKKIIRKISK